MAHESIQRLIESLLSRTDNGLVLRDIKRSFFEKHIVDGLTVPFNGYIFHFC